MGTMSTSHAGVTVWVQNGPQWAKTKVWAGCVHSGAPEENPVPALSSL